jgi:hypothetical protein
LSGVRIHSDAAYCFLFGILGLYCSVAFNQNFQGQQLPILRLKIDRSMMRAYLTISGEVVSDSFTKERVLEFIKTSGVHSGVLDDTVEDMVQGQLFDKETLVAVGQEPVPGEDGRIEYKFNPHPVITPEVREDGSVDYMNVHIMQKVVPGQIVARTHAPGEGKAGFDTRECLTCRCWSSSAHWAR